MVQWQSIYRNWLHVNPELFSICVVTVDGEVYQVGDDKQLFTIQSISKVFAYGLALEDHGRDYVLTRVGVEPTGDAFNAIILDEQSNRPLNPMVNALRDRHHQFNQR
jgi:glutaminase